MKVVYRSTDPATNDRPYARTLFVRSKDSLAHRHPLEDVHAPGLSQHERDYLDRYHGDPAKRSTTAAHKHSINHRTSLLKDTRCGCFQCERIFHPQQITDWIEDRLDGTAECPYCGTDTVIGEGSGYPITPAFLKAMHLGWCGY